MNLSDRLHNISIIGAGGKMGSGIVCLLAREIAREKLQPQNRQKVYRLNCIDVSEQGLEGLQQYAFAQTLKFAEKQSVWLRDAYADRADLVENAAIINQFTADVVANLRFSTDLNAAKNSLLVFEAIIENKDAKVAILNKLRSVCPQDCLFLTNTSSLPIGVLNREADLDGRIIGFHFYNPPVIQKLVEVIPAQETRSDLAELAADLGKRLRRTLITSSDQAGFIGNGHFARDGLHGLREVDRLSGQFGQAGATYLINKISQDLLVRPMGIFQLIDFVGCDVFHSILDIINQYVSGEELFSQRIEQMVDRKILGGQWPDGSQKDGFLKYVKGRPVGVYDLQSDSYLEFDPQGWTAEMDKAIGPYPENWKPWKALLRADDKVTKLAAYFDQLTAADTLGGEIARAYLRYSLQIGEKLVADQVAETAEDVNQVLINGFYHLYGPINRFI